MAIEKGSAEAGKRLKVVRETLTLSQAEFARAIQISQRKVSRIETGQPMDRTVARRISNKYDISEGWLMFGSGEPPALLALLSKTDHIQKLSTLPLDEGMVRIPLVDPDYYGTDRDKEEYMPFPKRLYKMHFDKFEPNQMALMWVQSDVMAPGIDTGDMVMAINDQKYRGDGIYIIRMYENFAVRRLQRNSQTEYTIISDNSKYSDQVVGENLFEIFGKVLWVSHLLN